MNFLNFVLKSITTIKLNVNAILWCLWKTRWRINILNGVSNQFFPQHLERSSPLSTFIHAISTWYSEESIWFVVTVIRTHSKLGCGTRPVSFGSRRRRAEWTYHVVVASVLVHVRFVCRGGGLCNVWTCQKLLSCYGTLREPPTMPNAHLLLRKAMSLKFVRMFSIR